jgi:hypothetical protein
MDLGHITQLAKDELGRSKVVYRQDLSRPPGQAHLKVDDLGAGGRCIRRYRHCELKSRA